MTYKIFDVGTVAIFLDEGPGGRILGLTLPEGEKLPGEFKIGDSVELTNHPSHLISLRLCPQAGEALSEQGDRWRFPFWFWSVVS